MMNLYQFLSGAAMMGAIVAGLHFLKFWSKSKDRLFLMFGVAFWIMAIERLVLVFIITDPEQEDHSIVYIIRLIAFLMILYGIFDKNRADRTRNSNSR